jgi:hypothetical protein
VIPWVCVHAVLLGCTPSVDEFRSQDFGLKLNWEAPMGSDLCILVFLQNGTADKTASTRSVIGPAVARLFRRRCRSESGGRLDLWRRLIWS